jgi:hypothetical protein
MCLHCGQHLFQSACALRPRPFGVESSSPSRGLKLLWLAHAWISVPSTEKCSRLSSPAASARFITSAKNASITSCSSSRSRFFENTEWSHTTSSIASPTNQRNSML